MELAGSRGLTPSPASWTRSPAIPVTQRRGLLARLNYLLRTDHAKQAARTAGLTISDDTIQAWRKGKRQPSKASLQQVEAVYCTVRRQDVARHFLKRLNSGGGTRVEIHPINQSQVARPLQRDIVYRNINVRRWHRIVGSWAASDHQGLARPSQSFWS